MDILQDIKFKQFLQNREIQPLTKILYSSEIRFYSEFLDLTPSQIIDEAIKEEKSSIWISERRIKEHLLDYKSYLINQGYTNSNILKKLSIVKSFYSEFEIQIPKIKYAKIRKIESLDDLPTKEEIQKALKFANTKYQSIIYMALATGLRASDLRALKYSDFLKSLHDYITIPKNTFISIDEVVYLLSRNPEPKILTWKTITQKTTTPVTIFTTPETLDSLILYLTENPPKKYDDWLFPSKNDKNNKIGMRAFSSYFRFLNDKCQFGKIGPYRKFRSHALRKLFGTLLNADGMPHLSVERLLGHSVKDIVDAYIKVDENSLKQQYIEHMHVLSLKDIEVDKLTTDDKKEFLEIKEDNISLRQELEEIKKVIAKNNKDRLDDLIK
ncbi:MAG: site-specific integrase [Methanobacterium sp. ERen5]|nr:MAG: site-specific integrase [Methanobacterium sp. ERen5]